MGEIEDAPRTYNGRGALPYLNNSQPCGTAEEFANGVSYDPIREPTEYNADNIPLCCSPVLPVEFLAELEFDPVVSGIVPASWGCPDAVEILIGQTVTWAIPSGGQQWYLLELQAGDVVTLFGAGDFLGSLSFVWRGVNCSSLLLVPVVFVPPTCFQFTAAVTGKYWLVLSDPGAGGVQGTFTSTFSSCPG